MSRRMAMHGRPSKPLHLAETESAGDAALQLGEAIALLGETATADDILAVVTTKRPWLKNIRKPLGTAGAARPAPGAASAAAGAARPSPRTTDGTKLCSNCGETGHDKVTCKQPKVEFSKGAMCRGSAPQSPMCASFRTKATKSQLRL